MKSVVLLIFLMTVAIIIVTGCDDTENPIVDEAPEEKFVAYAKGYGFGIYTAFCKELGKVQLMQKPNILIGEFEIEGGKEKRFGAELAIHDRIGTIAFLVIGAPHEDSGVIYAYSIVPRSSNGVRKGEVWYHRMQRITPEDLGLEPRNGFGEDLSFYGGSDTIDLMVKTKTRTVMVPDHMVRYWW